MKLIDTVRNLLEARSGWITVQAVAAFVKQDNPRVKRGDVWDAVDELRLRDELLEDKATITSVGDDGLYHPCNVAVFKLKKKKQE
jgi:hypothetical protein